jgi:outer membrane protein assembly factor BamB
MRCSTNTPTLALLTALLWSANGHAQWTQFRGSDGSGVAESEKLPLTWSETRGVKWKVAIQGRAWSSPIVLGKQVWVTTATLDGRDLFAVAVDRDSGKVIHNLRLFHIEHPQAVHSFNTYASPSPVAEAGRVCVTFGSPGTACLDPQTGRVQWARQDLECNHLRGAGSSPILFEDLLIMQFDGTDQQYVVALDKRTGVTKWKTRRSIDFRDVGKDGRPQADGDFRKAFATPHIVQINGSPLLISLGSKAAYGYDPTDGREIWRVEDRTTHNSSTRPIVGHGLVIYQTGITGGHLQAIRPDGHGDISNTHVVWRTNRTGSGKPSLLVIGELLFAISDNGIATCRQVTTGELLWTARVGGTFSASPVATPRRIYFFDEEGKTTVINAAGEYKVLAESYLNDGFMASPAIAGDSFFLRTRTHLYRIGS